MINCEKNRIVKNIKVVFQSTVKNRKLENFVYKRISVKTVIHYIETKYMEQTYLSGHKELFELRSIDRLVSLLKLPIW